MPNIIPERIRTFDVYINGAAESGIAEGDFPDVQFMTSELKGAGIAGTAETIVPGLFGSITCTLKWRTTPKNFFTLAEPRTHDIDLYGDIQSIDAGSGSIVTKQLHIYMKAQTKHYDFGTMTVGAAMDAETEHEIFYLKVDYDGATQIEIDKFNYKYVVKGSDFLTDSRRAIGKQ